jgi:acetyl esterase/lipase
VLRADSADVLMVHATGRIPLSRTIKPIGLASEMVDRTLLTLVRYAMSSLHLVDPELLPILDLAPDMGVSPEKLAPARAAIAAMTAQGLEQADPRVAVKEWFAPGYNGGPEVRVVLYKPDDLAAGAPVVLQIHGGGFLFGTAELGDPRNRAMARAVGCAVASVEYRLAPETVFPAGLDDCYAALLWLHGHAAQLGLDPARIAIRGESAGGGLAAGLAIMARNLGGPAICLQLLVYPMLDDRTVNADESRFTGQYIWDRASNRYAWDSWLGMPAGSDHVSPIAAPARTEDLAGLPPTCITTAALDLFVEEDLEYARRLVRAGVATEVYLAAGAFHGFDAMVPEAAVTKRFIACGEDALRRAFS